MKTLILIRHAEAVSPSGGMSDFDRPLSTKGQNQAREMRGHLPAHIPFYLLSSASIRTTETTKILSESRHDHVHFMMDLYNASAPEILNIIAQQRKEDHVIVVAHNPGISQLYFELTGQWIAFEPCSMGIITTELENWSDLLITTNHKGTLISPQQYE